eukprot:MONOS_8805.1-p1 / transcript=MONOS_8805.1 / gene=MONOS_8805 / organism=Monocercomonoides_exilis_PA203 / gene_product=unspecified product / transcript_product=unspecified product / location=Mono_scaffold00342:54493-57945(+) / protein_length=1087 / sequence_SO=supercontig / SO=protein_coding / is_pseudo=false
MSLNKEPENASRLESSDSKEEENESNERTVAAQALFQWILQLHSLIQQFPCLTEISQPTGTKSKGFAEKFIEILENTFPESYHVKAIMKAVSICVHILSKASTKTINESKEIVKNENGSTSTALVSKKTYEMQQKIVISLIAEAYSVSIEQKRDNEILQERISHLTKKTTVKTPPKGEVLSGSVLEGLQLLRLKRLHALQEKMAESGQSVPNNETCLGEDNNDANQEVTQFEASLRYFLEENGIQSEQIDQLTKLSGNDRKKYIEQLMPEENGNVLALGAFRSTVINEKQIDSYTQNQTKNNVLLSSPQCLISPSATYTLSPFSPSTFSPASSISRFYTQSPVKSPIAYSQTHTPEQLTRKSPLSTSFSSPLSSTPLHLSSSQLSSPSASVSLTSSNFPSPSEHSGRLSPSSISMASCNSNSSASSFYSPVPSSLSPASFTSYPSYASLKNSWPNSPVTPSSLSTTRSSLLSFPECSESKSASELPCTNQSPPQTVLNQSSSELLKPILKEVPCTSPFSTKDFPVSFSSTMSSVSSRESTISSVEEMMLMINGKKSCSNFSPALTKSVALSPLASPLTKVTNSQSVMNTSNTTNITIVCGENQMNNLICNAQKNEMVDTECQTEIVSEFNNCSGGNENITEDERKELLNKGNEDNSIAPNEFQQFETSLLTKLSSEHSQFGELIPLLTTSEQLVSSISFTPSRPSMTKFTSPAPIVSTFISSTLSNSSASSSSSSSSSEASTTNSAESLSISPSTPSDCDQLTNFSTPESKKKRQSSFSTPLNLTDASHIEKNNHFENDDSNQYASSLLPLILFINNSSSLHQFTDSSSAISAFLLRFLVLVLYSFSSDVNQLSSNLKSATLPFFCAQKQKEKAMKELKARFCTMSNELNGTSNVQSDVSQECIKQEFANSLETENIRADQIMQKNESIKEKITNADSEQHSNGSLISNGPLLMSSLLSSLLSTIKNSQKRMEESSQTNCECAFDQSSEFADILPLLRSLALCIHLPLSSLQQLLLSLKQTVEVAEYSVATEGEWINDVNKWMKEASETLSESMKQMEKAILQMQVKKDAKNNRKKVARKTEISGK